MYMTAIRAVPGLGCCHSANRVAWLHRDLRNVPGRDPEPTDATGPETYVEARARECAVRLPAGRGRCDSGIALSHPATSPLTRVMASMNAWKRPEWSAAQMATCCQMP